MTRGLTVVGVALPGLALAGFGLVHPTGLDLTTASAWWQLHVLLIPVFPLVAAAIWVLLDGAGGVVAWAARVAAYGYAAFYTGLDVLAGIGAGLVFDVQRGPSASVDRLFQVGDMLGHTGVWCLLAAALLTGVVLVRRDGLRALPGTLVLAAACYPFYTDHIFTPNGVLAMLGVAVGCALLAAARRPAVPVLPTREPVPQPTA